MIWIKHLHDKGGVGWEWQLLGSLLQQLKLSQLHAFQLPVTLPAPELLLEWRLKRIQWNSWLFSCIIFNPLWPSSHAHLFGHRVGLCVVTRVPCSLSWLGRFLVILLLYLPQLMLFGLPTPWVSLNQLWSFCVLPLMTSQNSCPSCLTLNSNILGWRNETSLPVLLVECGSFPLDRKPLDSMCAPSLDRCRLWVAARHSSGLDLWFRVLFHLCFWQRGFTIVGESWETLASLQKGPLGNCFSSILALFRWGDILWIWIFVAFKNK